MSWIRQRRYFVEPSSLATPPLRGGPSMIFGRTPLFIMVAAGQDELCPCQPILAVQGERNDIADLQSPITNRAERIGCIPVK